MTGITTNKLIRGQVKGAGDIRQGQCSTPEAELNGFGQRKRVNQYRGHKGQMG